MKKILGILLFVALATNTFATNININGGILSGAGASWDLHHWELGVEMESTIPIYSLASGFVVVYYDETTYWEGVKLNLFSYLGLNAFAFRDICQSEKFTLSAGLDIHGGLVIPNKNLEIVLKPALKFSFATKNNNSIFAVANYPLLNLTMAKGFSSPYIRCPDLNKFSLFTGWRIGYKILL